MVDMLLKVGAEHLKLYQRYFSPGLCKWRREPIEMCDKGATCVVLNQFKPARLLPALSCWLLAVIQPGCETSRWIRETSSR